MSYYTKENCLYGDKGCKIDDYLYSLIPEKHKLMFTDVAPKRSSQSVNVRMNYDQFVEAINAYVDENPGPAPINRGANWANEIIARGVRENRVLGDIGNDVDVNPVEFQNRMIIPREGLIGRPNNNVFEVPAPIMEDYFDND